MEAGRLAMSFYFISTRVSARPLCSTRLCEENGTGLSSPGSSWCTVLRSRRSLRFSWRRGLEEGVADSLRALFWREDGLVDSWAASPAEGPAGCPQASRDCKSCRHGGSHLFLFSPFGVESHPDSRACLSRKGEMGNPVQVAVGLPLGLGVGQGR